MVKIKHLFLISGSDILNPVRRSFLIVSEQRKRFSEVGQKVRNELAKLWHPSNSVNTIDDGSLGMLEIAKSSFNIASRVDFRGRKTEFVPKAIQKKQTQKKVDNKKKKNKTKKPENTKKTMEELDAELDAYMNTSN
uniref:FoP_duplication domain-containing protein n=1 Tax=Caenorhabditis japonica TaxID=281687 RepID=A0A8R1IJC3_CAEJA